MINVTTTAAAAAIHREALRLMQAKDWPNALLQIDRALAAQPEVALFHINRAQCLMALGRRAEACEATAVAERRAPADAFLADAAGSIYSFCGDQRRALQAYERAVALTPDSAHFIFNRATVRRFLGQLDAAEVDYDRVIALRPNDFEAYKNRSDLRPQTVARNHIAELERVAARGFSDWRGEVQIRYSLAKEYEDIEEYAKSFAQLQLGARKRREHLRYDVANDVATVDWIIDAFQTAPFPPPHDCCQDAPIFIVGLPRSGTTLVDRILSSHTRVESAGELNDFALALVDFVRRDSGGAQLSRRELVARSANLDFAALGHEYMRRARSTVPGGDGFTDKMPLNYLYCGLIRRALPNAKIIHLTRHPMAAGYAIYKTLFKDGYPFSYDLGDIGGYYIAYRRLMEHWQAALPGAIHQLSYESLVSDQLGETRALLEFCGLEWQDACLDFHRNSAATTTASASQIRRPMYDSSVAQWRHYAAQLAVLRDQLHSAGIEL
jgi:tetratricopeptide (TPR) repeat protein